jgi:hypothetical protein
MNISLNRMKIKLFCAKGSLVALALCFSSIAASCQKPKAIYYLKGPGYVLPNISGADYLLLIMPPDTSADKDLFQVKEYYANGDLKFVSGTKTIKLKPLADTIPELSEPVLQGGYISYYHNGHKMEIANYTNGIRTGDGLRFYPNGKLYYAFTCTKDKRVLYNECRDSTGKVLFENGNGKGLAFLDENFRDYLSGHVVNGLAQGEWVGKQGDTTNITGVYKDGHLKGEAMLDNTGQKIYLLTDPSPAFPGGPQAFARYLLRAIHITGEAREKHIKGRLVISVIIEKDGTTSNIKLVQGLGYGCDEDAMKALKNSPRWRPGTVNGDPVRVKCSVPVNIDMSDAM